MKLNKELEQMLLKAYYTGLRSGIKLGKDFTRYTETDFSMLVSERVGSGRVNRGTLDDIVEGIEYIKSENFEYPVEKK